MSRRRRSPSSRLATIIDKPALRIRADDLPPPERTPAQMLTVLTRIVNRKVEALNTLTSGGTKALDALYDDDLAKLVDLVCKLSREERMSDALPDFSQLTDQQLQDLKRK